ncbi:MAG: lysophospholipid acyltransferase family protein [Cytophagales bacterium]|nr:lysophospholipid acyltransferase family protein [Cytophagales bacterium]MDW8383259.1 lysophospholipid acyltransferase family protein [Flammeovirgaceae bacterium]
MELIEKEHIISAAQLDKFHLEFTADFIMKLFDFDRFNEVYAELSIFKGVNFVNAALERLKVKIDIPEEDLKHIPQEGSFIVVANHPFGLLDGLVMIKLFGERRPDFKIPANFLLKKIEPVSDFIMPVNPFDNKQIASSVSGLRQTFQHIQEGHPIGLFPAGEVSTYQSEFGMITDRQWQDAAIRIVKKANVPVLPMYFQGSNSLVFHLLGLIHPNLRTARIPTELFKKENSTLVTRIGSPISPKELSQFDKTSKLGRYLRAKTYALGSGLKVKRFFKGGFRLFKPKDIIPPTEKELILNELDKLPASCKIHTQKNYELYIATADLIPNILNEIGRLREITFREVGEGSNKKVDLDEFDLYYHHLFLFDREKEQIVGAYRMGKGNDIFNKYGKKGFYVNSLFKFDKSFEPIFRQSIELGRSFIVKEYQAKPLSLFILWKGLLYFLLTNPEYKYLLGPVSISNSYSHVSKSLLIEFIKQHYYDENLAKLVQPRKDFEPNFENLDTEILAEKYFKDKDMTELDKLIGEIEQHRQRIPVLLKKYIKQNAKIISFNIDPKFNDALDGLMILDLKNLPEETINSLKKEMNIQIAKFDR